MNYPLKVVVCDQSMGEIAAVAKEIFPKAIIQTCLKHYSESIDRVFKVNGIKRRIRALQKKLDYLAPDILISTHKHNIEKAKKLTEEIASLQSEYGKLITIQSQ